MKNFKATIRYLNGGQYHLYSDDKHELISIVSKMTFENPGVYEVIPIENAHKKLLGIIGPDGAYKEK